MAKNTSKRDDRRIQRSYGAICLMDALGSKNILDKDEIRSIIKERIDVKWFVDFSKKYKILSKNVLTLFFSDTVLFVYPVHDKKIARICDFISYICFFFSEALSKDILYRGAISVGEFYMSKGPQIDDAVIVGPAINDAATYYEQSNWVGISLTPSAFYLFHNYVVLHPNEDFILEYDVPLKNVANTTSSLKTYAINWPKEYITGQLKEDEKGYIDLVPFEESVKICTEQLYNLFGKKPIPLEAMTKYKNTLEFFEYCIEREKEKQASK